MGSGSSKIVQVVQAIAPSVLEALLSTLSAGRFKQLVLLHTEGSCPARKLLDYEWTLKAPSAKKLGDTQDVFRQIEAEVASQLLTHWNDQYGYEWNNQRTRPPKSQGVAPFTIFQDFVVWDPSQADFADTKLYFKNTLSGTSIAGTDPGFLALVEANLVDLLNAYNTGVDTNWHSITKQYVNGGSATAGADMAFMCSSAADAAGGKFLFVGWNIIFYTIPGSESVGRTLNGVGLLTEHEPLPSHAKKAQVHGAAASSKQG